MSVMVEYFTKRSKGESFERQSRPLKNNVWVNAPFVTASELDLISNEYGLDRNILYDVQDRNELPRIEFSGSDAYVFIRIPRRSNSGRITTSPALCVIKGDTFLTIGARDTVSPELIASIVQPSTIRNTFDLLVGVVAACTASYQGLLQRTSRSINDTALKLHSHDITNKDFVHFVTVEDNLMACRMNLSAMQAMLRRVRETTHESMNLRDEEALDDVQLEIEQLLVAVESYTGRVDSIRNAYTTVSNNTMNIRVKTLTVLTVLITLPNVIFGMYGMNVKLPIAENPLAYVFIVVFSIILVAIVYFVGRKTKAF